MPTALFSMKSSSHLRNRMNWHEAHAIHVSKFPLGTQKEDIVEHVMQNTSIVDPEDFLVETLGSAKSDYVSYKISTISTTMYDEIKNIWSPHYVARDFRPIRKNTNMEMKRTRPFGMKNVAYPPNSYKKNYRDMRYEKQKHTPMKMQGGRIDKYRKKELVNTNEQVNK